MSYLSKEANITSKQKKHHIKQSNNKKTNKQRNKPKIIRKKTITRSLLIIVYCSVLQITPFKYPKACTYERIGIS